MIFGVISSVALLTLELLYVPVNSLGFTNLALAVLLGGVAGLFVALIDAVLHHWRRPAAFVWGKGGNALTSLAWGGATLAFAVLISGPIAETLSRTKYAAALAPLPAWVFSTTVFVVLQRLVALFRPWGQDFRAFVLGNALFAAWAYFEVVSPLAPHEGMIPLFLTTALVCGSLVCTRLLTHSSQVPVLVAVAVFLLSALIATRYDTTDPQTAQLATSGPVSMSLSRGFTALTDLDGDGFSRDDCSIWDSTIHPNAIEVLGNGVDENCSGVDEQWLEPPPWESPAQRRPRNVMLVSIDTLRFDAVGKVVNGESLTPRLDAFSRDGVVFTRAYAPSTYTNESMPSIMSSEYPQRWHAAQTYFGQEDTIAQMLAKSGYQTLAVIAFPWLHDGAILGFETVDNEFGLVQKFGAERGRDVVARMFDELDRRDERPLLAWVHLFEPHAPNPGKLYPGFANDALGRYYQDVKAADVAFGEFVDGLASRGLLDDSLIFVFADHGEALGEHNMTTHLWAAWNSVTHVPLIARIPGVGPRTISVPVSTIDILPTIAELLGLPVMGLRDGRSLPLEDTTSDRDVFTFADSQSGKPLTRALVQGDKKLIWDVSSESWLLFDIVKDPHELSPLDDPALMTAMRSQLLSWLAHTRNDRLLKRKAELWQTRELFYPLDYKGDVGLMLELTPR